MGKTCKARMGCMDGRMDGWKGGERGKWSKKVCLSIHVFMREKQAKEGFRCKARSEREEKKKSSRRWWLVLMRGFEKHCFLILGHCFSLLLFFFLHMYELASWLWLSSPFLWFCSVFSFSFFLFFFIASLYTIPYHTFILLLLLAFCPEVLH